jgi:hypothetical protein
MIVCKTRGYSQCNDGGTSGDPGYGTTTSTGGGNYVTQFKFPKLRDGVGMIICIGFCRIINGRVTMHGYNFSTVHLTPGYFSGHNNGFICEEVKNREHNYFFSITQAHSNMYARFSEVKLAELKNTDEPKINIYLNASNGVVGIKFVNILSGKF